MAPCSQQSSLRRPSAAAPPHISGEEVRRYLDRCAVGIERHRAYLTRLDAVLGDGDHGDNMAIGFQAIRESLSVYPPETSPGELLRAVGHRLATAVGGASGPLYGTALIEAGLVAGSEPTLDVARLGQMLDAAAAGLARRGRCMVGDKTILDALRPAADAFAAAKTTNEALRDMVVAASRGMRATRPLVARRGIALRLGARSAGHLDPGAVSCFILLAAMAPARS